MRHNKRSQSVFGVVANSLATASAAPAHFLPSRQFRAPTGCRRETFDQPMSRWRRELQRARHPQDEILSLTDVD